MPTTPNSRHCSRRRNTSSVPHYPKSSWLLYASAALQSPLRKSSSSYQCVLLNPRCTATRFTQIFPWINQVSSFTERRSLFNTVLPLEDGRGAARHGQPGQRRVLLRSRGASSHSCLGEGNHGPLNNHNNNTGQLVRSRTAAHCLPMGSSLRCAYNSHPD